MPVLHRLGRGAALVCWAVALLVSAGPALAAEESPRFQVGDWRGFEIHEGEAPRDCVAVRDYGETRLRLRLSPDGQLEASLSNPSWRLGVQKNYPVGLLIDQFARRPVTATGIGSTLVMVLGRDKPLYDALAKGSALHVVGQDGTLEFALDHAGAALRELAVCARHDTSLAEAGNHPFGDPTDSRPRGQGARSDVRWGQFRFLQPVEWDRLELLLDAAGFEDAHFQPEGLIGLSQFGIGAAWEDPTGEIVGTIIVAPRLGFSAEELTSLVIEEILGSDEEICGSGHAKIERTVDGVDGRPDTHIGRLIVECEAASDEAAVIDLLFYILPEKFIAVWHAAIAGKAARRALAINDRIAEKMRLEQR